ncbi:MAG: hypothetical protein CMI31_10635 [Opitutae bacterium]|nr:hypothetical protein [Opitutae bacterium]|tara:strand:+ start:2487 stop:3431 length:945 start_codon:yes stop_codon:yes gene_type:complete
MKIYNKIIALVAALGLVGVSFAQDEAAGGNLTDNISIAGFIDGSYSSSEAGAAQSDNIGIDEVEIDFLFGFGSVSAEVHVDGDGIGDFGVEQAFVTYDAGNGFSVTLGSYGSALGLEREDPTGLSTVSRAYQDTSLNLGDVDTRGANEGVAISYSADDFSIAVSFEDSENTNIDADNLNTEVSISYTGIENLAIGGGFFTGNGTDTTDYTNLHLTYNAGKALIAAEWVEEDNAAANTDVEAMMISVDYDVSDKVGIVLRYSEEDSDVANQDNEKFTIAPNYSITDNLGAILEFSDGEQGTTDVESVALELTLTF